MTKAERERRLLVMLRAYVDESSSGDSHGRFVIAGFVAFCHEWEDFTELWAAVLAAPPSVPYFRMSSFRSEKWRKEHGITKEQAGSKLDDLTALIKDPYFLFSTIVSISQDDYSELIGPQARRFRLDNTWLTTPYNYCLQRLVAITTWKINKLGICGDQIDFVFDDNDALFDDANRLFRELRKGQDEPYRSIIGDAIPGNDQTLKPLQVADLFAARVKDYCVNPTEESTRLLRTISGRGDRNATKHLKRSDLQSFALDLAATPGTKELRELKRKHLGG
jgi:hypothetical protein